MSVHTAKRIRPGWRRRLKESCKGKSCESHVTRVPIGSQSASCWLPQTVNVCGNMFRWKFILDITERDQRQNQSGYSEDEMKERWGSKSVSSVGSKEKSGSGTIAEDDREPPIDKCWIVFMIILLNGIGVLLPWNMFITIAPNYYVEYWFTVDGNKTSYAKSFMSALGISAQIPNFIVGVINVAQIIGGSLMIRIVGPLTLNCLNVVAILALVIFQDPSEEAMNWFYIVSLVIVMVMNASNGLYQNSVFGLAADFPAAYTNALVVGNNVCGTFTSVLAILTTVAFPTEYKTVALIYFSISLAVLILCGISLIILTRLEFYQFYVEKGNRFRAAENAGRPTIRQFLECFKGCWMQLLSIILVFFVTLSVFPTVLAGTTPNGKGEPWNSGISKELYPGITTFLVFNFFAAVGSTTANFIQFPGPRLLIFPVLARLLFIPFFMLCNYNVDDRVMPVWFKNEWFFIIGNVIMALSSGYFSSLGMMYAPRVVPSSMSKTAGMAAALCLVTGIMAGVAFTPVITLMVNNIG
ncbi:hypothetical protein Y032_0004g1858 [Ancylostoma ceylanicum]|uniref:Nucleoside transporter n=1 Tax=Ancylostoma ceylanicum TaxID=53326 RepID=A0A016VU48_9BILA|nr:hypothetical protein Y032_0004g1858 [Ancylostoma ceylanicum]